MDRAAVDVGADPEVDADGAGVEVHAFFAVVHVLEVLLEQGDVDDLAGDEGGVVEGGGEGFGVGVGAGTWRVDGLLEGRKGYIYIQLWGTRGGGGGGGRGGRDPWGMGGGGGGGRTPRRGGGGGEGGGGVGGGGGG